MALPPPSPSSTCLVTGASSGIGADIARELGSRSQAVTLVARREDRLAELADELRGAHGVRVETIAADVSDESSRRELVDEVVRRGLTVEVLVNNAGFGSGGLFHRLDAAREVEMVRTNCEAVVHLCGEYVPQMVERGRGGILNVASVAAFQPLPKQATYSASKAFVLHFTEALDAELIGTGVNATALCPGPVATEFGETAGLGAMDELPDFVMVESPAVARAAVDGLERGRRVVIPGALSVASAVGGRFIPHSVLLPMLRRFYPVPD